MAGNGVLPANGVGGGGILGRFAERRPRLVQGLRDNSNALTGFGLGLLSGSSRGEAWGNAAQGLAYGQQADQAARDRTKAEQEQAAQDEAVNNLLMSEEFQSLPQNYRDVLTSDRELARAFIANDLERRTAPPDAPETTDDITEYGLYVRQTEARGQVPLEFNEWDISRRRAGAPNYYENRYAAVTGEADATLRNDLLAGEQSAYGELARVDRMAQLIDDPTIYTGVGEGVVRGVRQLGVALGLADANTLATGEEFIALSNQAVLDRIGGSLGTAISNGDRDFIQQIVANRTFTPEGNRAILAVQRALAQRAIEMGQLARQYEGDNGRIDAGFYEVAARYAADHPLFGAATTPAALPGPAIAPQAAGGAPAAPSAQAAPAAPAGGSPAATAAPPPPDWVNPAEWPALWEAMTPAERAAFGGR